MTDRPEKARGILPTECALTAAAFDEEGFYRVAGVAPFSIGGKAGLVGGRPGRADAR